MVEIDFKAGDRVKLRLGTEEIEGQFLDSPESSIVLLKLESGYNIGIKKENILAARKLPDKEKRQPSAPAPRQHNPSLPSIGMIITGGTIASKLDTASGGVKPLADASEFENFYPELFSMVNVKKIEIPFLIASESMDSSRWIEIAEIAKRMIDDPEISGVIVTHGTDTLSYTSAALSFFLQNLSKPIVLTYSQRSIDRASSDARLNLLCAAKMATSDCAEVMIVGHANLNDDHCQALRGTKVRKNHSSRRDAFQPVNAEPIAKVWPDKIEFLGSYNPRSNKKVELDTAFTDKVALVKLYPGQDPSILDYYALNAKGIVIEGTGFGHVPSSDSKNSWLPKLKKHIREGLIVCITSQTLHGSVNPYVYTNLRDLADTGAIFLEDMLSETAFIKLGFVLGHAGWKTKARERMLHNMAGEITSPRPKNG